jgi:GT2 family glycosyltransferase/glycosyltransferase involved in cell wall biosynthesis
MKSKSPALKKKDLITRLIEDAMLSFALLKREGLKSFFKRIYWYFRGYRLAEDIPTGADNLKPIRPKKQVILNFNAPSTPLVSIIIPVFNQWNFTYNCLSSILKYTSSTDYEIIVADDVSSDKTINILKYVKNITVIRNETNLGFLRNINNAASFARGKYLYLLNNDTAVTPGWLDTIVHLLENDSSIGMAGSKLIFANGRLQEAGGIIFKDASGWNYGRYANPDLPEYNYVKEVDYCSGAGICVKKDIWDHIGGFDERFAPAYYEDTDLAFSVRALGYKVVYQPRSVIFHFEGISHGKDISSGIKSKMIENQVVFYDKWKAELDKNHAEGLDDLFAARNRSLSSKTIVMIDHYVPRFDMDAGSRSTFQYLKLLDEMGLNVIFIPDNFQKSEPYTGMLQQIGIEVLYGPVYRDSIFEWLEKNDRFIDYIYLSRPNTSIKYIGFIKETLHAKIIYQPHDLHFLRTLREYEITKDDATLAKVEKWKETEMELFRNADISLTFSTIEKSIIESTFNVTHCHVVPLFLYESFPEPVQKFKSRKDLIFVGGFNHPPNTDAVLWFANEILPSIIKSIPDIKLHVVGANAPAEILELANDHLILHGFATDEELDKLYNDVRIVVLPLRYGAGVKGKLIEAMYFGMPVVATDVALEGIPGIERVLKPKNTSLSFSEEIIYLYNNKDALMQQSIDAQNFIRNHFSFNIAKSILREVFNSQF